VATRLFFCRKLGKTAKRPGKRKKKVEDTTAWQELSRRSRAKPPPPFESRGQNGKKLQHSIQKNLKMKTGVTSQNHEKEDPRFLRLSPGFCSARLANFNR